MYQNNWVMIVIHRVSIRTALAAIPFHRAHKLTLAYIDIKSADVLGSSNVRRGLWKTQFCLRRTRSCLQRTRSCLRKTWSCLRKIRSCLRKTRSFLRRSSVPVTSRPTIGNWSKLKSHQTTDTLCFGQSAYQQICLVAETRYCGLQPKHCVQLSFKVTDMSVSGLHTLYIYARPHHPGHTTLATLPWSPPGLPIVEATWSRNSEHLSTVDGIPLVWFYHW